ncbi:MAG: pyridoxal phosphate-dependent aminotransferase [Crocinitomicaceae bacterium]|nr:pyridoxal phosphate-dependent aminotransferase [Crocinitomicaceae bacterium]
MHLFDSNKVNFELLKKRAFNLRWAELPDDVIPLTAADPDFKSAPEISEAIIDYCQGQYFSYGPSEGLIGLKKSVASFFVSKRNVPAAYDFVLPVDSTAYGIYLTCKTILNTGDEAIIFDPVDFLFKHSIEKVGAKAIPFSIPPNTTKVDFHKIEHLITDKTKLICLCNPLNPTGKVFTKSELITLGSIAVKYNLTILSDEIWSDIVYHPAKFVSIASLSEEIRNKTITVTGFSKSFGMAGLRIGVIIAHNEQHYKSILDHSMHKSTIHGVNILSQVGAIAALEKCDYWLEEFVNHTKKMRDLLVREINSIPNLSCIAPDGCYVAFVNIEKTNKTSQEVYEILLNEAKVAVVPGLENWFGKGAEGYIRICFSTSEAILKESISRIKKCLT